MYLTPVPHLIQRPVRREPPAEEQEEEEEDEVIERNTYRDDPEQESGAFIRAKKLKEWFELLCISRPKRSNVRTSHRPGTAKIPASPCEARTPVRNKKHIRYQASMSPVAVRKRKTNLHYLRGKP